MATNEVFEDADNLPLPVTASTLAGSPVVVGGLIGVCLTDAATSTKWGGGNDVNSASVQRKGVFTLQVTGVTAVGTKVYIAADYSLSITAGSDTLFGYALDVKGAPIGPVRVALAQV